jgi:hypothetical protein
LEVKGGVWGGSVAIGCEKKKGRKKIFSRRDSIHPSVHTHCKFTSSGPRGAVAGCPFVLTAMENSFNLVTIEWWFGIEFGLFLLAPDILSNSFQLMLRTKLVLL